MFEASQKHGSQCIVVAIDAKQVAPGKWEVFTHGGRNATGLDAVEWARKLEELGAGELLLTSMDRDGTKSGFDLGLTRAVSDAVGIPVIASGGVGGLQDLADGITRRPCRRGAGGQHFPLRPAHGRRSQALHGRARHPDAAGLNDARRRLPAPMRWLKKVQWDEHGLVPVIAQEAATGDILMFAWMNREALAKTVELGEAVYWSRSRKKLWHKGEESGHVQKVLEIRLDCDDDVVLLKIEQAGGIACHTGRHSCFYQKFEGDGVARPSSRCCRIRKRFIPKPRRTHEHDAGPHRRR